MGAAVAAPLAEKKAQPTRLHGGDPVGHIPEADAGRPEGVPLFLQRAPLHSMASALIQRQPAETEEAGEERGEEIEDERRATESGTAGAGAAAPPEPPDASGTGPGERPEAARATAPARHTGEEPAAGAPDRGGTTDEAAEGGEGGGEAAPHEGAEEEKEGGEEGGAGAGGGGEGGGEAGGDGEGSEGVSVQTKLLVGPARDSYEQEADRVAHVATAGERGASPDARTGASGVQLKCTACRGEEEEEEDSGAAPTRGRVQRICKECEEEKEHDTPQSIQRKPDETASGPTVDEQRLPFGGGAPLSSGLRTQVEALLGYDLGHVRVHQDGRAHEAARDLSARAFTHREHIWLGRGERADDVSLMAHELTHVVQQGAAPTPAPIQRRPLVTPLPATSRGATGGVVQRGAIAWIKRKGKAALLWAVRRVSSEIAEIIDKGPLNWLKDKILVPIKNWLGRVFSFPRIGAAIESLKAGWHDAVTLIQGVLRGDPKSCQQFKDLLGGIRAFAAKIADSRPIRLLRSVFGAITKAIGKVYRFVIANAIEALRPIISGAWNLIKRIAAKVSGWLSKVKRLVSRAWNWVKEKLGFGGEDGDAGSESGVWAWIKRKATAAWNVIKGPIMRVAGPVLTVLKVLSLFTGLGQIYLIIKYGPQVVESVKWLWANWGDPNMVRKAHKEMSHTFLPRLLDSAGKFGSMLRQGTDWLIGKATALAEGVLTLLGVVTGIPLLSLARRAIAAVSDGVKSVLAWGQNLLSKAADAVTSFFHKIWKAIEPYKEVLSSIVLAIINPPMIPLILAGWAWRLIPDNCIKAAIIDFLLDILIAALEALPDTPFFGPLWPLLRSGVLGFLRGLKAQSDETKEKVSNKIAKIISGASPEFLFGFVKGVLLGVWEGITDPFKAIWSVIEGLHWVGEFLEGLATAALAKVAGGPAAGAAPAAPAAPPPAAAPARPSTPAGGASAGEATSAARAPTAAAPAAAAAVAAEEDAGPATGDMSELAGTATAMAGELGPDLSTVTGNFWDAAKEYFSSGEGMTFGDLVKKFGEFWDALKEKVEGAGREMAQKVSEFFVSDEAEGKIGESVGWLVGTIGFQILLDVLTAGAWAVAYPTLAMIARFINWPMEVLGRAFKLLAKLGKYIVDGVKGLGKMVAKAGAGAFKVVTEALGRIGEKLGRFAEEIIGKFVGRGGGRAVGALEREGGRLLESGGTRLVGREGTGVAERGLVDVEGAAARDARVADSARIDSPHLTPADANAELAHITDRPGLLEGVPPNRRARIGEHEWVEGPGGVWCRHSTGELCTKLPADLEEALEAKGTRAAADLERERAMKDFLARGGKVKKLPYMGERAALVEEAEEFAAKHRDEVLEQLLRVQGTHRDTFFKDVILPELKGRMPPNTVFGTRDWKALEETLGVDRLPWRRGAGRDLLVVDSGAKHVSLLDLTRRADPAHAAIGAAQAADLQALLGKEWSVEFVRDFYHSSGITTKGVLDQIGDVLEGVAKTAK